MQLFFQTGFEGSSKIINNASLAKAVEISAYPIDHFAGEDSLLFTKNNFEKDLNTATTSANFFLEYTGGDATKRFAKIVEEPGKLKNHVLQFWLNDFWKASEGQQKARVQASLYGIKPALKEFYQKQRVFFSPDFEVLKTYPKKISWLTISEFWNNEWWVKYEPFGFRITLGIGKSKGVSGNLHFILNGENAGQKEVWNAKNTHTAVPIAKWFTLEYYFKEGNAQTGRFYVAITPEGGTKPVVFDVINFTHNTTDPTPNGLSGYNPMKLYTSKEVVGFVKAQGKTLQIFWDDFKLWNAK